MVIASLSGVVNNENRLAGPIDYSLQLPYVKTNTTNLKIFQCLLHYTVHLHSLGNYFNALTSRAVLAWNTHVVYF